LLVDVEGRLVEKVYALK
jgi:hypothetical protein